MKFTAAAITALVLALAPSMVTSFTVGQRNVRLLGKRGMRTGSAETLVMSENPLGPVTPGGFNTAGKPPIEIRGFSLAKAFLTVGVGITISSFVEYGLSDGGAGLSSLGFIYGIPISLIGFSLQYAELAPAALITTKETEATFMAKATPTMKEIKSDVTRHRYGDEAHLDTTVKALGLVLPQKDYPQLQYLEENIEENGEVSMTMCWQSIDTPFRIWDEPERLKKYDTFFGPGVYSEVIKIDGEKRMVAIKLTTGERPAASAVPVAEEAAAEA